METLIKLPPPQYKVEQINEKKKRVYRVTLDNATVKEFGGVTGVLGVVSKPALYPWYANQATENARAALVARLEGATEKQINLTQEWVDSVIEAARKTPEKVKDDAASLGTQAHAYFEDYIYGKAPPLSKVSDLIKPAVERFLGWFENSGLAVVAGDTKVASLRFEYGGALDAIFRVVDASKTPSKLGLADGDFVLGDYKTSNGIYDEYALQVAAYDEALNETYGIRCQAGVVVRFGKTVKKDRAGNPLPLDFEQKWLVSPYRSFHAFLDAKSLQDSLKQGHFIDE